MSDTQAMRQWEQTAHPRKLTVWATPDQPVTLLVPAGPPPRYVLCKLFEARSGEYFTRPITLDLWLKRTPNFCKKLGIDLSDDTLARLVRAGFIQTKNPAPMVTLVSLESLIEHLNASASPNFWTRERRLKYINACDDLRRLKGCNGHKPHKAHRS